MTKVRDTMRLSLVPGVAALAVWLVLLAVVLQPGVASAARARAGWMLDPVFHDWHVIQRGWHEVAAGRDPLSNPAEPYNYPRLILVAAWTGVSALPVSRQGLLLAAVFLATLAAVLRPRTLLEAVADALLVFSLPVLLIVERGNLDQLAFVLVVFGLLCLVRGSRGWVFSALGAGALLLAGLLKLYPLIVLAGVTLYWRDFRRWWAGAAMLAAMAWCTLNLDEIALVLSKTTRGLEPAYGRMLPTTRLQIEGWWTSAQAVRTAAWGGMVASVSGVVAAAWWGLRRVRFGVDRWDPEARVLCLAGSMVYVGTYLLGFNWSYRLIFLFLCVPGLWSAARDRDTRLGALAGLAAIAVSLLAPVHQSLPLFAGVQVVQAGLAGLLSAVAATLLVHGGIVSGVPLAEGRHGVRLS